MLYHVYTTMGDVWVRADSDQEAADKAIALVADQGVPAVMGIMALHGKHPSWELEITPHGK